MTVSLSPDSTAPTSAGVAAPAAAGRRLRWWPALGVASVALLFGLVNSFLRPLLKLLTCPLILMTLGFFTLVINALMLMLTGWLSSQFGLGFHVDGFWAAFVGGLIVGLVSLVLSLVVHEDEKQK